MTKVSQVNSALQELDMYFETEGVLFKKTKIKIIDEFN